MNDPKQVSEALVQVIRLMVTEPGAVAVDISQTETSTHLRFRVSPADIGHVIGKTGRNIRALRTIAAAMGGGSRGHGVLLDVNQI